MKNNELDIISFSKKYFSNLNRILNSINLDEIKLLKDLLELSRTNNSYVFFIGNGGSASTASHMANDLAIGSRLKNPPLKTMSLCDNNSIITAIGNDFGYQNIFTKQLEYLANKGDLLISISASGNSKNLINAANWANKNGVTTFSISSFDDGGEINKICKHKLHIKTDINDYGTAEDSHLIINHVLVSFFQSHIQ